jgi:hypothetical protein
MDECEHGTNVSRPIHPQANVGNTPTMRATNLVYIPYYKIFERYLVKADKNIFYSSNSEFR